MAKAKKRLQVRRCAICNKVGHNKSTCPQFLATLKPVNNSRTVNFFVHHVSQSTTHSPHVIDLKKNEQPHWSKVTAESPSESANPAYHFYHEIKSEKENKTSSLFAAPLTNAQNPFSLKNTHKNSSQIIPEKISSKPTRNTFAGIKKLKQKISLSVRNTVTSTKNKTTEKTRATKENIKKSLNLSWKKIAWAGALMVIAVIAPGPTWGYYQNIKNTTNDIAQNGTAGFMALQDATTALMQADMNQAQESISKALNLFDNAVTTMETKHRFLQNLASALPFIGDEVMSRQKLVLAGQQLTLGNTYLLKGLSESQKTPSSTLTAQTGIIITHLRAALPNYEKALENLQAINTNVLPLQYQGAFNDYRNLFKSIFTDLKNLSELGDAIQESFGGKGLRRYLLVFQNVHELRPTGGFMGSFAILTIKDGEIINLEVPPNGTYDLKKQLDVHIEPPRPMLLANRRWEFQDANWFPDFPASAEKILWFYQHSRQETADGVIAINSTVLERILGVIGPVTDEKRGLTLTADNAIGTIQNKVETWDEEKKDFRPKQIISDLSETFLQYFKNIQSENLLPLLVNLQESLEQKEVQMYFTDQITEKAIKDFGWAGQILHTKPEQDYLLVVNTNIQGQKTDAKMKQVVSHQAIINPDGTVTDTVTITRTHTGSNEGGLYGSANINYLRIYVPQGSRLISASGFSWPEEKYFRVPDAWTKKDVLLNELEKEISIDDTSGTRITNEFGKTAFGNWTITEPGQTTQVEFVYQLPTKIFSSKEKTLLGQKETARYQLIVQRQSGSETSFESQIILPENWTPVWKDGNQTEIAANGMVVVPQTLKTDRVWSLIAKQK